MLLEVVLGVVLRGPEGGGGGDFGGDGPGPFARGRHLDLDQLGGLLLGFAVVEDG